MDRFVVISGGRAAASRPCSQKSTLLLERRGHPVVPEPGRRIVEEERQRGGTALPWTDAAALLTPS